VSEHTRELLLVVLAYGGGALGPFVILLALVWFEDWRLRRQADYFKRDVAMVDLTPWGDS
jgi:hypothetical protein